MRCAVWKEEGMSHLQGIHSFTMHSQLFQCKNGGGLMCMFLNGLFDILILIIAMLKLFVCMYS